MWARSALEQPLAAGEQLGRSGVEAVRDLPERRQRRHLIGALQFPVMGAIQPDGECRRFLAEVAFFAKLAERVTEGFGA
jgi:hypothetical protein